jgi:nicotinate-nucleotide pyrophosphorylase (carboxylating)
VTKPHRQIEWDAQLEDDCRELIRLAIREDLDRQHDWTTVALVGQQAQGRAVVVARQEGIVAGLPAARLALEEYDHRIAWSAQVGDGQRVAAGERLAQLSGPARSLLTAERLLLNLLGHLSGVATLTRRYVEAVAGTSAAIFDTRKTMPGWRRLEKYAVRAGGGCNHRLGLFDGVLIKDNHLALGAGGSGRGHFTPAEAVRQARKFLDERAQHRQAAGDQAGGSPPSYLLLEVEVDTLEQLDEVLSAEPDIVLLDNMTPQQLAAAVARRDAAYPQVQLEASGGITLETVGEVARAGVDRISVGALTHSAPWFDVALEWE